MSKARKVPRETDLSRYDWSRASRGRFAAKAAKSLHVALIDPALWEHFGSSEAVNDALRALVAAAKSVRPARSRRPKSRAS